MIKKSIIYGSLAGLFTVLIFYIAYGIDRHLVVNSIFYWSTFLIYIVAMVRLAKHSGDAEEKEEKSRLKGLFLCFLIANLIFYIYNFIFITQIDPALHAEQMQALIDLQGQQPGIQVYKGTEPTITSMFLPYFQTAIFGFILSLLIDRLVK